MSSFSDDYGFIRRGGGGGNLLGSTYFGVWVSHVMMIVVLMINENKLDDNNDRTEGTNSLFKC
jgi:hypothetical protein